MKSELTKDKYLALALVILLLGAYVYTSDETIKTLLVTAVGGFLGLVRSSSATTVQGGQGAPGIAVEDADGKTAVKKAVRDAKAAK